jgi:hypothetical protein
MNVTDAAMNPGWSTAFGAMISVTNDRENINGCSCSAPSASQIKPSAT